MSDAVFLQPRSRLLVVDLLWPVGAPTEALNAGRQRPQTRAALSAGVARCEAAGLFTVLLAPGEGHAGDPSGVTPTVVAGVR